jgi:uncharacterized protein YqjF (DUF2071 family)
MNPVPAPAPERPRPQDASVLTMDRVGPTRRPERLAIGYQRWESMLFLHWPLDPEVLRPLVPARLDLDTCEGHAWLGLTLFTVSGARVRGLPELPLLSRFNEVNVRTYVHLGGRDPGVWCLSLDASNLAAAAVARSSLGLPYFPARISRGHVGAVQSYRVQRWQSGERAALSASWRASSGDFIARPGTLEYFLTERYFLYSRALGRKLLRQQVHHRPWVLCAAERVELTTSLERAAGVPDRSQAPLAHDSPGVEAELFLPRLV